MDVQLLWTIRPYLHIYYELIEHLHQVGGVNSGDFIASLRLSNAFNPCFWESVFIMELWPSWIQRETQKYHPGVKIGQKSIQNSLFDEVLIWAISLHTEDTTHGA